MINYRRLNLPSIPVKDPEEISARTIRGGYNLAMPSDVLTDEIMDIFQQYNLKPIFVTLFGTNKRSGAADDRMIHTDLRATNPVTSESLLDPTLLGYRKMRFGINWEILNSSNMFSWWDMGDVKECWPDELLTTAGIKYTYLNGIHYGARGRLGIPQGATKLEEVEITGPTLVRTDLPHMTSFNNPHVNRVGVSIRFDDSRFNSWNDVTDFFKPMTI